MDVSIAGTKSHAAQAHCPGLAYLVNSHRDASRGAVLDGNPRAT